MGIDFKRCCHTECEEPAGEDDDFFCITHRSVYNARAKLTPDGEPLDQLEEMRRQRDEAIMMLRDAPRPELFYDASAELPHYAPFDDGYGRWYNSPERHKLVAILFPNDGPVTGPKRKYEVRHKGKVRDGE